MVPAPAAIGMGVREVDTPALRATAGGDVLSSIRDPLMEEPMRSPLRTLPLLATLLALPSLALADPPPFQPGEWEITMVTTMTGMPMAVPPTTTKVKQCMTEKDMVPDTSSKDQKCTVSDTKVAGSTVSWKVVCDDKGGRSEGTGEVTYSAASYKGTIKLKIKAEGQTFHAAMKMDGRRLGDCKGK
jgi:hypothetical protein